MVARSKKKVEKAHALRKRIKAENKRLRARSRNKKKDIKPTIKPAKRFHLKLDPEVREKLMKYCFLNNKKPWNVIRVALNKALSIEQYIEEK